jgi:hypothetical protein
MGTNTTNGADGKHRLVDRHGEARRGSVGPGRGDGMPAADFA